MPAPYDYTLGQVPDPTQSFVQGINLADALRQREEKMAAAQEAQRQAQRKQEYMSQFMGKIAAGNATVADYEGMKLIDPANYQSWESSIKRLDSSKKEAAFNNMSGVFGALSLGTPAGLETAKNTLKTQIAAAENSGQTQNIEHVKSMLKQLETPEGVAQITAATGMSLNAIDPERFKQITDNIAAQRAAPFEQRKVEAGAKKAEGEATKEEIAARYAEPQALIALQEKGWNIKKLQQEISTSQQQSRLALMQAQLAKEDKDLKRQELQAKIDEAKRKQSADLQQKVADVEGARFNIDNMLNTADRILKNPSLNSVIGTIQGRAPVLFSDEAQDAVALIETLGSQAFLSQIPNIKGMGSLSNAEGEKLQNAFQNLGRVQSEKQFKENLKEAQRLLIKARQNVSTRYGMPETVPDTPAAQPSAGKSVDQILKELGVSR